MNVTFYTDNLTVPRNGTISSKYPEKTAPCYYNSSNCREVMLSTIKKCAKINPYYHWVLTISSNVSLEDAKRVVEVLELPVTLYKVTGTYYIAGDVQDWIEFNYALSLLLYFLKYTADISIIFNEDAVRNTLPLPDAGRGSGQRVLVLFGWYLAFIRGFKDFKENVSVIPTGSLNGIMSFIQSVLFIRYPELVKDLEDFLKGNPEARRAASCENYVKIRVQE